MVDGPHAHHALLTPTDDTGAVRGAADCSHSPLMRVMDGVQQLPTLRPKSTDLAITPATDDALPILDSCRGMSMLCCRRKRAQLDTVWGKAAAALFSGQNLGKLTSNHQAQMPLIASGLDV